MYIWTICWKLFKVILWSRNWGKLKKKFLIINKLLKIKLNLCCIIYNNVFFLFFFIRFSWIKVKLFNCNDSESQKKITKHTFLHTDKRSTPTTTIHEDYFWRYLWIQIMVKILLLEFNRVIITATSNTNS